MDKIISKIFNVFIVIVNTFISGFAAGFCFLACYDLLAMILVFIFLANVYKLIGVL